MREVSVKLWRKSETSDAIQFAKSPYAKDEAAFVWIPRVIISAIWHAPCGWNSQVVEDSWPDIVTIPASFAEEKDILKK